MTEENIKDKRVSKNGVGIAHIRVARQDGQIVMHLKLCKDVENVFKNENITSSTVYRSNGEHLKYYKFSSIDDASMRDFEMRYNCHLRQYGSSLYISGLPNFSLIRSVGTSKGTGIKIKLDGILGSESIKNYIMHFKDVLKAFYKEFVSDVVVQSDLRIQEI
jgi:hypothetical protein